MIYLLLLILLIVFIYLGLKRPGIALLTCPFVIATVYLLGLSEENPIVIISAGMIFLSTIIAILFSKSEPDQSNWPKTVTRIFIQFFLITLLIVSLFSLSPPLGFIGLLFTLIFIAAIISYLITSRYATISYVISTIGSCIRQNLPLPMALETAASEQNDRRSRILLNIKKWLVQGYSISESIRLGFPGCPGYAIAMIRASEKINQLPLAIEAIENNMSAQARERRRLRPVHPLYPVVVICFMFFILSGIMVFVMPQVLGTLSEMVDSGGLPPITLFILNITNFIINDFGFVFLLIIGIAIIIIIPMSIYTRFRSRNPDEPYFLSLIGDRIKWYLPVLHWFEKNYSMVQTIEMLRLSLNAGCPVNEAIANAINLDVNYCFKQKLRNWLEKVESGYNISQSAETSKLGASLAWAFDDKVNQGNTIQILEALESFYRSNYSYSINMARFIMWPCIIILLGFIVSIVVLAIFLPGVTIIESLARLV